MADMKDLEESLWELAPDTLQVRIRRPQPSPEADDSLEFHAARLLLLIYHAGGPKKKRIDGRTKLAKMDFLIRYPTYLVKAAQIKGVLSNLRPIARPESRMIRFKYGPWDANYYNIFAYLIAKDFIDIHPNKRKGDVFQLTDKGIAAALELEGLEFGDLIERCKLVYELFGSVSGTAIKDFIYLHFPEIVGRPLGAEIEDNNG
jgi:hypothetical protein